ncbi:MAG: AI-2E family transporter [Alphaproteobacteria bacterium]|nr:AI-2E family transporter [Alphaproteobacteria bacterium]MDD9920295.1 AI-2E family transporter [Alphaproteobacteria bacterium]
MVKDKVFLLIGAVLFLILLFLWQVQAVLTSFIVGMVLAYLLDPIVEKAGQYGINRTFSSLVPVALFYVACLFAVGVGIPLLVKEALSFLETTPNYQELLAQFVPELEALFGITLSLSLLAGWLGQFGQEILQGTLTFLGQLGARASAVGDTLSLLIITPLVAFYLLREWPQIVNFTQSLVPPKYKKDTLAVFSRIDTKIAGFVRGQLLVCIAQGLFYGIGLWLVGVKMGFLLGMLTGLFSFIPVVGGLFGLVLTLLVAAIQFQVDSWMPYAGILAVFAVGNILESFVLTPKLVGDRVGLPPVWIIFALLAGGQLAGIVGMLVAVPVAAVVAELLPLCVQLWKKSKTYSS